MNLHLLLACSFLLSLNVHSTIRFFYIGDDYNQFFSDEGLNNDLTVEMGDTLQWLPYGQPTEVDHTITSTSIPFAASDFDYQWSPPENLFFEYIPTELGMHEFECTLHAFVFNMVGSFNVVESTVGIESLDQAFEMPYPNPFEDRIYFDEVLVGSTFTIVDLNGKVIVNGIIQPSVLLPSLPSGFYVMEILYIKPRKISFVKI